MSLFHSAVRFLRIDEFAGRTRGTARVSWFNRSRIPLTTMALAVGSSLAHGALGTTCQSFYCRGLARRALDGTQNGTVAEGTLGAQFGGGTPVPIRTEAIDRE